MIVAVGLGQRGQAPHPDGAGRDLRHQIALERVGDAHIAPQDLEQRVVEPVALAQLEGRQADALLEHLGGIGRHRARRHAAHVLVVRHGGGERQRPAAREHRRDDGDVRQVRAAEVGVVHAVDIALLHAFERELDEDAGNARDERGQVDRYRHRLRQGLALQREQAGGGIQALLHDRRERAAQQRQLHLVGDAVELVAHHLHGDRIEGRSRR